MIIALASQGLLSLEAGIALSLGANIGTCATALLATIGKPRDALRVALIHVLFNLIGATIWLPLIDLLAAMVGVISPAAEHLDGVQRLAAETPRQIANAHTLFNILNTAIFLPLTRPLERLVVWLVPHRPRPPSAAVEPRHLDPSLIASPPLALAAVRQELRRVGERVLRALRAIIPAVIHGDELAIAAVHRMDEDIDVLHGHVIAYLSRINTQELTADQSRQAHRLIVAANAFEQMSDVLEKNLVAIGRQRLGQGLTISPQTRQVIDEFCRLVIEAVELTIRAVCDADLAAAATVHELESRLNAQADRAAEHLQKRLLVDAPRRIEAYRIEMDILENLRRVYDFAKRIADAMQPEELAGPTPPSPPAPEAQTDPR